VRPLALATLLALVLGCGGASSGPPAPVLQAQGDPAPAPTASPADLPERLEIEYRRRTEQGDDLVLKLTPAGARYGLAFSGAADPNTGSRQKARVALRYQLPPDALGSVYAALQQEGFERIQSAPHDDAPVGGTSLRVSTAGVRHSVSAMGRHAPVAADAPAYARCLAAVEALLPRGRSDVVVHVRWDASMTGQSTGLDVDVGTDLVGLHHVPAAASAGEPADSPSPMVELHLAQARPLQLQLRDGSSTPRATTLTVQAGVERGVVVAFDAEQGRAVLRPLPPATATPK
jgi:hypothetical protein